jgi:hypothetical protein
MFLVYHRKKQMPKRDKNGKYIDHETNTVEDAARFQQFYNYEPEDVDYYFDDESDTSSFNPGWRCTEESEDPCKCSDPCCPCTGWKIGVP